MATTGKLPGILSLSAASMALLQSTIEVKGQPMDGSSIDSHNGLSSLVSKTDKVILEPAHQKELLVLLAGHTSHASHSSHVSGMGSRAYVPDPTPSYAPAPTYPAYVPPPPVKTNAENVGLKQMYTPKAADTNTSQTTQANGFDIDSLTKQAAEGSSYAQYSLGISYLHGLNGIKKNVEKGKMLLELSAAQGNAFAKQKIEEIKQDENKPDEKAPPENQPKST